MDGKAELYTPDSKVDGQEVILARASRQMTR